MCISWTIKVFDIIDARCNHEDYTVFRLRHAVSVQTEHILRSVWLHCHEGDKITIILLR